MELSKLLTGRWRWRSAIWVVIWLAIASGVWLRFYDLGAKAYWEDETFTSLRLSGHTEEELIAANFQGQVVYPEDLMRFQVTSADRGLGAMVVSLADDDTHPPGYFALLRLWAHLFGSSVTATRALSAVLGLLLLPCIYALALVLFADWPQRQAIAGVSAALAAVSPYQIELANEARMYSLLPVMTTLAGVLLLRSLQKNRRANWGLYGLVGTAGLYVHWFSVPFLAGHGLYLGLCKYTSRYAARFQARPAGSRTGSTGQSVLYRLNNLNNLNGLSRMVRRIAPVIQRSRSWRIWNLGPRRYLKRYLWATALALVAIVPWLLFVGHRLTRVYYYTRWTGEPIPLAGEFSLTQQWLKNGLMLFFHGELLATVPLVQWAGGALALMLIAVSAVFLVRHTPLPVWSFLLIYSGAIFGPLAIADLLLGGQRSTIFRYLSPSLGAIEIMVAFFLVSISTIGTSKPTSSKSMSTRKMSWRRSLTCGAIMILLVSGAASQTISKATFTPSQQTLGQVASIVNQTPQAWIVSDSPRPTVLLPLAHLLKADTPLQLTVRPEMPTIISPETHTVFLYETSEQLQARLVASGHQLAPVPGVPSLLQLNPRLPARFATNTVR